jgi:hypothetical protein
MKSRFLRIIQDLLVNTGLYRLLRPFNGLFFKLFYVVKYATWRNSRTPVLHGYKDRFQLYQKLIELEILQAIDFLEFGVSKGESMRWWLTHVPDRESLFFGFDTFEGIPEDWGTRRKGSYTNEGNIPEVSDNRCHFYVGLFQDTLGQFLSKTTLNKRLVVHLDADLYSSTLYCLFALRSHLKCGDLVIFDEFDITTHEFRAFDGFPVSLPHYLHRCWRV